MSNNYSLAGINAVQLGINLGLGYDKLVRYRPDDISKYIEEKDFIENYINGQQGISEGYLKSTLTGLPIVNRYAEISYKNDKIGFDKSLILETIFINVDRTKNIVKNQVMGLNGTVKEFVNSGDYVIRLTGTISSDSKWLYPEEEMIDFIDLCNVEDSISISNDYLNKIFQVDSIVIESFSFAQSEKFSNIIAYTINCISDYSTNKIIT